MTEALESGTIDCLHEKTANSGTHVVGVISRAGSFDMGWGVGGDDMWYDGAVAAGLSSTSRIVRSPLGDLKLLAQGTSLSGLSFAGSDEFDPLIARSALLEQVEHELHEYFQGRRRTFDVLLDLDGTDFQQRVWHELLKIPFAETISYAELAKRVGSANGFRAVGAANGANPIAIIVPCHRVINTDGQLGGYGGDLWRKRWLLEHERRVAGMPPLDLFGVKMPVGVGQVPK